MKNISQKTVFLLLSIGGVLFSGYLSGKKFFTDGCAFNEPCPYFLGYPSCYFGFGLFLIIFVLSLMLRSSSFNVLRIGKGIRTVSLLGVLFALYFTIPEIKGILTLTSNYSLGLPTCAYGLVFFLLIFILSVRFIKINTQVLR